MEPTEARAPLKRSELTRLLAGLRGFSRPDARSEQIVTPAEEASSLLWEALMRGDLAGRKVLDLGCGTGTLAIGAAFLGAESVLGVDADAKALGVARENAASVGVKVTWVEARLTEPVSGPSRWGADTVVMNPPFGAQKKHADRPFLEEAALAVTPGEGGAVYLLANGASQAFIERWSIARHLTIEDRRRSTWPLPPTLPHHREARGRVEVDRWILRRR